MERKRFQQIDYVVRMPKNFEEGKRYPLVIYLHGAGGRGRDLDIIYNHPFFSDTVDFLDGAVCLAPQCYEDSWFSIFEQLQEFVNHARHWSYVDITRVYLVGASMGGYGTWQLAMARPEWFAAIVPICGGGMYWNAGRLVHMGVWAFHGDEDGCVYPEESKKMVDIIQSGGGSAKLTLYKNTGHNAWTPTFQDKNVWEWLLSHQVKYEQTRNEYDNVEQFG